jgi:hypothetical protein
MRRILLAWEIGVSFGHLARLIPVARHLQERGDRVTLAVRDPGALAVAARAAPLPCRRAPHLAVDSRPRAWSLNYADVLMRNGYADPTAVRALVGQWTALIDEVGADLVVAEHAPGALLAARVLNVRRIAIGSGFSVPPLATPQPTLQPWFEVADAELVRRERAFAASINQALAGSGLRPLETAADLFADVERRVCTWPELDHYGERAGDYYVGPLADLDGGAANWPQGAGPRVFFYGRGDRLSATVQIAVERGCRCLVYRPGPSAGGEPQSPQVACLPGPADLTPLIAASDLVVCEAPGTAMRFLLRGVPALLLPRQLEQELWAYRAEGRGLIVSVGVFSRGERGDLAAAFDRALSAETIRPRVRALAAAYAGGTGGVLARIIGPPE